MVSAADDYKARDHELGVLYRSLLAAQHAAEMAGWTGLAKMLRNRRRRVFVAQLMLASRGPGTTTGRPARQQR